MSQECETYHCCTIYQKPQSVSVLFLLLLVWPIACQSHQCEWDRDYANCDYIRILSNVRSKCFNRIRHLPFNISNTRSTAILILDCMKFQYCLCLESPLFEPLNGRIKEGFIGYPASPISLYDLNFHCKIFLPISVFWNIDQSWFLPAQPKLKFQNKHFEFTTPYNKAE